jgi:hypothetical protein
MKQTWHPHQELRQVNLSNEPPDIIPATGGDFYENTYHHQRSTLWDRTGL